MERENFEAILFLITQFYFGCEGTNLPEMILLNIIA
jgi:hypothetical protein